jgi:hypothetical protein
MVLLSEVSHGDKSIDNPAAGIRFFLRRACRASQFDMIPSISISRINAFIRLRFHSRELFPRQIAEEIS